MMFRIFKIVTYVISIEMIRTAKNVWFYKVDLLRDNLVVTEFTFVDLG